MTIPKLSEIGKTQAAALVFIVIITVCLAGLNVTGAWVASESFWYTGVVFGVELLAAVCLVLILDAPTIPRKVVGSLVFAALIFVCVENGKMAIEKSFSGIFTESSVALRAKADLAQKEADALTTEAPASRESVQTEIAELKVELELMTSQTRIEEAQLRLTALGLYTGRVDGLRQNLTEDAMRKRGEAIRKRLEVLTVRAESNATPAGDKGVAAIELRAKADEVDQRTVWMNLLLFAVEGARSAGLWAFVVWGTGKRKVQLSADAYADLQRKADELDERIRRQKRGKEKEKATKEEKGNTKDADFAPLRLEDQRAESVRTEAVGGDPPADATPPPDEPENATSDQPESTDAMPAEDGAVNDDNPDSDASERGSEEPDQGSGRVAA